MLTDCTNSNDCVTIKFSEELGNSSCYRLLELADPKLLAALEEGRELCIRGGLNDDVVLCTENQTFQLRELVTSNMFLVVEKEENNSGDGKLGIVVGRPSATLEATLLTRPPGIDQLIKALNEAPYNGGLEDEEFKPNDLIHVTRIFENVQASSQEIEECLKKQGVMIIKGKRTRNPIYF